MSVARRHSGDVLSQHLAGPHGEHAGLSCLAEREVLLGGGQPREAVSPLAS